VDEDADRRLYGLRCVYLLVVALDAAVLLFLGCHHDFECVHHAIQLDYGGGVGVGHLAQLNVGNFILSAVPLLRMKLEPLKGLLEAL